MSNQNAQSYPLSWGVEMVRNAQGRRWYFVSRFIGRTEVEYVTDASGEPARFRTKPEAEAARKHAAAAIVVAEGITQ